MSAKFNFNALEKGFAADWPVFVSVPQDGGTFERQEFTARFRAFTLPELQQLAENNPDDPHIIIRSAFVGLGKDEPEFTTELQERMLAARYVREALTVAYNEFCAGISAKN